MLTRSVLIEGESIAGEVNSASGKQEGTRSEHKAKGMGRGHRFLENQEFGKMKVDQRKLLEGMGTE